MKAVVFDRYGGPEVLRMEDIERPTPKSNEVMVKVKAVSINDWDFGLLTGTPFFTRLIFRPGKSNKRILGSDVAGVVEAVGTEVTMFKAGDEVFGDISTLWGGMAEYVCAPESKFIIKPASMSFADAAAIPQAGILAVQGLIDGGMIRQGLKVLINGGGGGVGTFGVQIAKTFNAETTGVDHTIKLEAMKAAGFDHVIDYTRDDFTKNGKQYDLILDAKTNRSIFDLPRALAPNGVYATVGGDLSRLLQLLLIAPIVSLFTGKKIRIVAMKANKDLPYLIQLFEEGKMKPVIDEIYPLDDFRNAFDKYGKSKHKGKIVITIP